MKLDKLLKKLKREVTASPQKATALGLMVLVALYFWAPLFVKFAGKGKSPTIAASEVSRPENLIVTPVNAIPSVDLARWEHVRETLAHDQLMTVARFDSAWANPFRLSMDSIEGESGENRPVLPSPPTETSATTNASQSAPDLSGIIVTSVLMSRHDRAAFIRGTTYRVGDVIEIENDDGESKLELLVTNIDDDGVDVNIAGRSMRLNRSKTKLAPGSHVKSH